MERVESIYSVAKYLCYLEHDELMFKAVILKL